MRKIILTSAIILSTWAIMAQSPTGSISQQIEVTKEYLPEINLARKLRFQPQIGDTITLRPEIDYSITPTPWKSIFGTEPIGQVNISTEKYNRPTPYYIKAAAGYPLQTILDFSAAIPSDPSRSRFGIYGNHYGQWSKLPNINGQKTPASWTENNIGIYGGTKIGRRMLDADINYGFRQYTPIEYPASTSPTNLSPINYNDINAMIKYGDSFTDFSKLNYRFGVSGSWLHYRHKGLASPPRNFTNEYSMKVFTDFGWKAGIGTLLIGATFDSWFYNNTNDIHSKDWYIGINPKYKLEVKSFALSIGAKVFYRNYNHNNQENISKVYIIPNIEATYQLLPALEPYIEIGGDVCDGSLNAISRLNPYITPEERDRPTYNNFKGGIKGSVAQLISYNVYAGFLSGNLPMFTMTNGLFSHKMIQTDWFYAGGRIILGLSCGFNAEFFGQYNNVNSASTHDGTDPTKTFIGIPNLNAGVILSYKYKNKLFFKTGLEYIGTRSFTVASMTDGQYVPEALNLTFSAEYNLKNHFSIFVEGDNLLNKEIYRFYGYRALGANVVAGVRINF